MRAELKFSLVEVYYNIVVYVVSLTPFMCVSLSVTHQENENWRRYLFFILVLPYVIITILFIVCMHKQVQRMIQKDDETNDQVDKTIELSKRICKMSATLFIVHALIIPNTY